MILGLNHKINIPYFQPSLNACSEVENLTMVYWCCIVFCYILLLIPVPITKHLLQNVK